MEPAEEWRRAMRELAARLVTGARPLTDVAADDLDALASIGHDLLATVCDGLVVLPPCDRVDVLARLSAGVDDLAVDGMPPIADLRAAADRIAAVGAGGGAPIVWAQERDRLRDILEHTPMPDRYRRTTDHMLWTRDLFGDATTALDGVATEIERKDGSGALAAKRAADALEKKAANPPVTKGFIERVADAISGAWNAIFG